MTRICAGGFGIVLSVVIASTFVEVLLFSEMLIAMKFFGNVKVLDVFYALFPFPSAFRLA